MAQNDHDRREVDDLSGTQTTGHEWDGIKELDTPLPRWWLWTLYATIVFSIGYVIYYPAFPLLTTSSAGISGITARGQLQKEIARVEEARAKTIEQIRTTPLAQIAADENLRRYAIAGGKSLFKVHCSQCHGSGAQGAPGYPNLNDDDWLWGGDLKAIYQTIAHGVRNTDNSEARISEMPAFGRDGILERADIGAVTEYVLKLSRLDHDAQLAEKGARVYADNCASCHGDEGKGNREFGAPNLVDALSLYGITRDLVTRQIQSPRHGVMPGWLKRLGEARVKQLAIYVHSLGGGEKAPSTPAASQPNSQ